MFDHLFAFLGPALTLGMMAAFALIGVGGALVAELRAR
jgi:hypothetical protein